MNEIDPQVLEAIRQASADGSITWQTLVSLAAPTLLAWFGSLWWAMRRTCEHANTLAEQVGSTAKQIATQIAEGSMTFRVIIEQPKTDP